MTRKKLAKWLNEHGFITTPEQITTIRLSQMEAENGAYPLWIEANVNKHPTTCSIGCWANLRDITKYLKMGYELQIITRYGSYELELIKK